MTAFLTLAFFLLSYFMPTLIAVLREAKSWGGVLVVNLFLGWTLLGWVIALAWAVSAVPYEVTKSRLA